MEGIRGEAPIAELCSRYGIAENTYYKWNKEFIEAGKRRLSGDELRQSTGFEVEALCRENKKLKESLADIMIRYDIKKKCRKSGIAILRKKVYETDPRRESGNGRDCRALT